MFDTKTHKVLTENGKFMKSKNIDPDLCDLQVFTVLEIVCFDGNCVDTRTNLLDCRRKQFYILYNGHFELLARIHNIFPVCCEGSSFEIFEVKVFLSHPFKY